jgi:hypothetical protein
VRHVSAEEGGEDAGGHPNLVAGDGGREGNGEAGLEAEAADYFATLATFTPCELTA